MQAIRRSRKVQVIVAFVISALLVFDSVAFAQVIDRVSDQKTITSCAVLPFANRTNISDEKLPDKIASAVALAMEDSREFIVTSSYDLEREMEALGFTQPLSVTQLVDLGEDLRVDKVLTGTISDLSVDENTGRARCSIEMRMLDVKIGAYLDGAQVSIETEPIPGWSGQVSKAINNAFRQVAETAVTRMLASRIARGQVAAVTDVGEVNTDLGIGDGVVVGTELLVMRPRWQAELEKTVLRRVGKITLTEVQTNQSWATISEGAIPKTGDLLYRIYTPEAVVRTEEKKESVTKIVKGLSALALLVGIYSIGTGDTTGTASDVVGALEQAKMGADPTIVLAVHSSTTEAEDTEGWLIYRGENSPYFPPQPSHIIDMIQGKKLPSNRYSDNPNETRYVDGEEISFPYFGEEGEQEVATVTASYNHTPLIRGSQYYYGVRRIIQPLFPPGFNPPVGGEQATEPVQPSLEWDPEEAKVLADISQYTGPITYFTAPTLSNPEDGAPNQDVGNVRFVWQRSEGADTYRVELFGPTQPMGRGNVVWASEEIKASVGTTVMSATFDVADPQEGLSPDTTYYWRVGAYATGDPERPRNRELGTQGWLYSVMRSFHTATLPPGPLSADDDRPRTQRTFGWFGTLRHGSTGR